MRVRFLGEVEVFFQFSYFMCLTYSRLALFRHLWHVQDGIPLFVSSCRCFWGGFRWVLNFFEVFVGGSMFQYYDDSPVNISMSSHLEFINPHWTWRIDDQRSRCNSFSTQIVVTPWSSTETALVCWSTSLMAIWFLPWTFSACCGRGSSNLTGQPLGLECQRGAYWALVIHFACEWHPLPSI